MGCQSFVGSLGGEHFAEYQSQKNTGRIKVDKHKTWQVFRLSSRAQKAAKSITRVEGVGKNVPHRAERYQVVELLHQGKFKNVPTKKLTTNKACSLQFFQTQLKHFTQIFALDFAFLSMSK